LVIVSRAHVLRMQKSNVGCRVVALRVEMGRVKSS